MALKIRLRRMGRRNAPTYRIVVAESSMPRDGRIVESIGHYNPRTNPLTLAVDRNKALRWLEKGAKPTETARALLKRAGVYRPEEPTVVEVAVAAVSEGAKKTGRAAKSVAAKVADVVMDTAADVAESLKGVAGDVAESATGEAGEVVEDVSATASDVVEKVVEKVEDVADSVSATASEVADEAVEKVEDVTAAVAETSAEAGDEARAATAEGIDSVVGEEPAAEVDEDESKG